MAVTFKFRGERYTFRLNKEGKWLMNGEKSEKRRIFRRKRENPYKVLHIRVKKKDEDELKMAASELGISESKAIRTLVKYAKEALVAIKMLETQGE